jgi:hypothetical protein
MKRLFCFALLALAASTVALGGDYRDIAASHELAEGQSVYIDFNAGSLDIETNSENRVDVELEVECKWRSDDCEDLLDEVEVDWRSSDRRLVLRIEGLSSWRRAKVEFDATIRVPATAALTVEMGAGSLAIEERANDLRVDMGAGEVRVWMDEAAVDSVSLDVGVGDAQLRGESERVSGRRSMLIGSEIYWDDGPGDAIVDIELGVGEAVVYLED